MMSRLAAAAGKLWFAACMLAAAGAAHTQVPTPYYVFVSDLHLGVGKEKGTDAWHPFEDFRWHAAFGSFLRRISTDGAGKTTLVMLGDIFELWQSHLASCPIVDGFFRCAAPDCNGIDPATGRKKEDDPELGCNEQDALARLENAITAHKQVFIDLTEFLKKPGNRLAIVPGNHDAALLFPRVAGRLLDELPREKVDFLGERGYWTSSDGEIRAEHGHQFDLANQFEGWPKAPFKTSRAGVVHLRRTSGEQLVQEFYNSFEMQFPIMDNVTEETGGLGFAIEEAGSKGVSHGLNEFFRLLFVKNSARQTLEFLGEQKRDGENAWLVKDWPAEWQARWKDPWFLVAALDRNVEEEKKVARLAEDAIKAGRFALSPADLPGEELKNLCNRREALRKEGRLVDRQNVQIGAKDVCPQPPATAGALIDRITGRDTLKEYLIKLRGEAPLQAVGGAVNVFFRPIVVPQPPFSVFIYGHTHAAKDAEVKAIDTWKPIVANTGAFHRVATPAYIENLLKTRKLLSSLRPEDLPECYSYVVVDKRTGSNRPALKYWVSDGKGGFWPNDSCPGMPK